MLHLAGCLGECSLECPQTRFMPKLPGDMLEPIVQMAGIPDAELWHAYQAGSPRSFGSLSPTGNAIAPC